MESISCPRITFPFLDQYRGRNVTIVGRVVQLLGDSAIIEADGNLTANLNLESHLTAGNGAQIVGKVNQDLTVRVLSSLDLGPDVDYSLANTVAEISQQFKEIHIFESE